MVRTNWKAGFLKTTRLQMHSVAFISLDLTTTVGPMYVYVHTCGAVHEFVDIYMCMFTALSNIRYRSPVLERGLNIKIFYQICDLK